MSAVNEKAKAWIRAGIGKLIDDSFDESSIRLLLIDIRDFTGEFDILREICHFVAHPKERTQGICHADIDLTYCKLRYTSFNRDNAKIPLDRVDKKLFDTLFRHGVIKCREEDLKQIGFDRKKARDLIAGSYRMEKGAYRLKVMPEEIIPLMNCVIGKTHIEYIFEPAGILHQLKAGIQKVCHELGIGDSGIEAAFRRNEKDLQVCMLCLLHDARFRLFDDTYGSFFLGILPTRMGEGLHVQNGNFGLMAQFGILSSRVIFPAVHTTINAADYMSPQMNVPLAAPLPHCFARRDSSGLLKLVPAP